MPRGLPDPNLKQAYRLIRARLGEGAVEGLARRIGHRRHAYVSRVLQGEQRRGKVWERLKEHLTPEEIALLERVRYRGKVWSFDNLRKEPEDGEAAARHLRQGAPALPTRESLRASAHRAA